MYNKHSTKIFLLGFFSLLFCFNSVIATAAEKSCYYQDSKGKVYKTNSLYKIPYKYRKAAKCLDSNINMHLAKPDEIKLKGSVRKESMLSSLGDIELQWPRSVEKLFGRTPERAMADAARAVSRALKKSGFPTKLRTLDIDWNVVFLDSNLPETQIPSYLVSRCHPGWMTPPSNIYIVGQRIAGNCSSTPKSNVLHSVSDKQLTETLIHEIGHVIEYQLLEGVSLPDRMRSEGFATWVTNFASDFVPAFSKGAVRNEMFGLAKASISQSPDRFYFRGSGADYARASLYFHAVVKRKNIKGLMDVYKLMREDKISFFKAVEKRIGWDKQEFDKAAAKLVM